jgi:hypothetical protein
MKKSDKIIGVKNDPEIVKEDPLGDDVIKKYLPYAKILKYNQLGYVNNIEDILPSEKSYCIILYENKPNNGHWVGIMRINNNIEYFDSYGNMPDIPLSWITEKENYLLGQKPFLTKLFEKTPLDVYYNDFRYQKENNDVNTCGRHVVFRVLCMLKNFYDLKQYCNFIKGLKWKSEESYDDIVSYMINLI